MKIRWKNKKSFLFFYFLKNDYDYHRFAVSVNRKIGNSVERNFIKRKMKELFRVNKHLVEGKHDLWIVMKSCFDKKNSMEVEEVEGFFIQALKKMDRFDGHKGKQHR